MKLEPLSLFPESALSHSLAAGSFDEDGLYGEIAVLRFTGRYRDGSRGSPDAAYMAVVAAAALARATPDVLVLDLRALDYRWGNSILGVFVDVAEADREYPVGLVLATSPRCRPALATLLGLDPRAEPGPEDLLQDGLEAALTRARGLALARARAIG
ncbi:MAG: hypothetical protein KC636_02310 [Myxococcales bacterium]|nr:hypothetical protein [Myxococcales bacterium]